MTTRPWERLYPPRALDDLGVEGKTLPSLLIEAIARTPDADAITSEGKRWSFEQVGWLVQHLAKRLRTEGLQPADRVAIMLPNCPEYVIGLFATWTAGGTVVQINPRYVRGEAAQILLDSEAGVLITTPDIAHRLGDVATTRRTLLIDTDPAKAENALLAALFAPEAEAEPFERGAAAQIAVIQYTGGTTGVPKGVSLSHRNILSNIEQRLRLTFDTVDVPAGASVVNVLPMSHVYGLTCVTLMAVRTGMNQLVLPRFDAQQVLETIRDEQPFAFSGVPTMYAGFLRRPDLDEYRLDRVTVFNSAGAGLPAAQVAEFEQRTGARIVDGFGISEASPTTHANPLYLERRLGSAGIPLPFTDVRIIDSTDLSLQPLPIGEVGELCIRGPQVMEGYWGRPDLTAQTLRDGWLLTGDLARIDDDGYVYIVGRLKDVIIASGLNVYPAEVEQVIGRMPGVAEVAVVGVPDDYRGETIRACVVLRAGVRLSAEEIVAHCNEHLARFKVPRLIEFRADLPRTPVGKIDRLLLSAPAELDRSDA
jgi:long-chain acyl-CoA synthetase